MSLPGGYITPNSNVAGDPNSYLSNPEGWGGYFEHDPNPELLQMALHTQILLFIFGCSGGGEGGYSEHDPNPRSAPNVAMCLDPTCHHPTPMSL